MLKDRKTGKYLHQSGGKDSAGNPFLTSDAKYMWRGTHQQMVNVLRLMPASSDFKEEVVVQI